MPRSGDSGWDRAEFDTTLWTVVLAAGDDEKPAAKGAMESLCGRYWFPIYAHVRRHGHGPQDAEDLTQGFFLHVFEHRRHLASLAREKGKFRSVLLAWLKNFLINEHAKSVTARRGGGARLVSFRRLAGDASPYLEFLAPEHGCGQDDFPGPGPPRVHPQVVALSRRRVSPECSRVSGLAERHARCATPRGCTLRPAPPARNGLTRDRSGRTLGQLTPNDFVIPTSTTSPGQQQNQVRSCVEPPRARNTVIGI